MATIGGEISVSTANGYIDDFITDYFDTNKAPTKSFVMDAQLIRDYLEDDSIENVKFVLGAKEDSSGGAPVQRFTLIVVGFDQNGNYVKTANGDVLDNVEPCPNLCASGDAGDDKIT